MISLILGTIKNKGKSDVTVLTSVGVGYEINVTTSFLAEVKIDEEVEIYTYLKVAETALELFGFRNLEEKTFFELLISVKGLGPRGALNILALKYKMQLVGEMFLILLKLVVLDVKQQSVL